MKQKELVEAPFDVETRKGTAGIGMLLDMSVGKDKDGGLISVWVAALGISTGHTGARSCRHSLARTGEAVWT